MGKAVPALPTIVQSAHREESVAPSDDCGVAYVRMLNHTGALVPVPAVEVVDKLREGYRFSAIEPCTPRYDGIADEPDDPTRRQFARDLPPPKSLLMALMQWQRELEREMIELRDLRPDLDFTWFTQVSTMIAEVQLSAKGQGPSQAPGTNLAHFEIN